jgi:hypothetical protein
VPYRDIDISAINSEDSEEKNCIRCSDMDMRIAARLVILIALIMVVTMVSEGSASRPLKLKFIFEGDQVENNNNIEMKNGLFESLPKVPYLQRGQLVQPGHVISNSSCKNMVRIFSILYYNLVR